MPVIDVIVIGAGFGGMHMVHRLRSAGFSVRGYEAGAGVGGTWYWNRYPGARCDSEVMYYSYSFLESLEQEWTFDERYPAQPQILRYLERAADEMDIRKDFTFNTRIAGAAYDEGTNLWNVRTDTGEEHACRWLVTATGCLSRPSLPDIEGADRFAGLALHTAAWPHEPIDFTDKRVGIFGTGSTGVQAIPEIAARALHLTVFQRTAQYVLPARNGPVPPELEQMWKANYQEWRRRCRVSPGGAPFTPIDRKVSDLSPAEQQEAFEIAWRQGGLAFNSGTFSDLVRDAYANEVAADFVRRKIGEIVHDPEVAEMLKPYDFPFGTKRLPLGTNYYETYNLSNVRLVSTRRTPVVRITPAGVETTEQLHQLDVLIYATGFDAISGSLLAMDIRGRGHQRLSEAWAAGPASYLGLAVPGFPNLFTITGPGSPSVFSNVPVSCEQHVEWIADCLEWMRERRVDSIEATEAATAEWTSHVRDVADQTLLPRSDSWYVGANVPGKPRVFLAYIGGVGTYRAKCSQVAADGYAGFELAHHDQAVPAT